MSDTAELERVLRSAARPLDKLGIKYHITGDLASSFYGEPRFTQDIDFVIELQSLDLDLLGAELQTEFLFDVERAHTATNNEGLFQALHRELLIKVDFHVGESLPGELNRSQRVSLFPGLEVPLVSKEDALLSKLIWAQQGSGKSRQDIVGMLLDPTPFDSKSVDRTAEKFGCTELWKQMVRKAKDLADSI